MVTRAIIVDRDLNNAKVQVRIPWIDGIENGNVSATPKESLSWASIVCTPGINVEYEVGDIVVVDFENNELENPIVLGYLKLKNKEQKSKVYIDAKELSIEDKFKAPLNSTLGNTSYEDVFNFGETDDKMKSDITNIQNTLDSINKNYNSVDFDVEYSTSGSSFPSSWDNGETETGGYYSLGNCTLWIIPINNNISNLAEDRSFCIYPSSVNMYWRPIGCWWSAGWNSNSLSGYNNIPAISIWVNSGDSSISPLTSITPAKPDETTTYTVMGAIDRYTMEIGGRIYVLCYNG